MTVLHCTTMPWNMLFYLFPVVPLTLVLDLLLSLVE